MDPQAPSRDGRGRSEYPLEQALYEIKKTIVGQDELLERMMVALLARGHLLVEGVPGLAKTMAITTLAKAVGGEFKRIQFTPDLVPADLIGTRIYNQKEGEFQVVLGPVFANLVLADEINRAPAKVQSALLEVMQERQVTIGRQTYPAPDPFLVMATQNPIESEGTYALPEAQVDRFMLKILLDYPNPADEAQIVARSLVTATPPREILDAEGLIRLQATLHGISRAEGKRRGDELLDKVGMIPAADRRVGTYSSGMQRRLDLASALVHEPRVLFLDEPTTGLDPVSRKTIWEEVAELNREGTTVFLTTQYLEEADQLANRVGIIDDGKLVAEDTPQSLKAEVGSPHLELSLAEEVAERANGVVSRFGKLLPAKDGKVLVELVGGATEVAPVVRALDDSGIAVESLELVQPSLDDVFVAKTGYHLEAEEEDTGEQETEPT